MKRRNFINIISASSGGFFVVEKFNTSCSITDNKEHYKVTINTLPEVITFHAHPPIGTILSGRTKTGYDTFVYREDGWQLMEDK